MKTRPVSIRPALIASLLAVMALFLTKGTGVVLASSSSSQGIKLPATGQTLCYDVSGGLASCLNTGQDGELKKGAVWPNPRFVPLGNCMQDLLTGLMWDQNGNRPNIGKTWQEALSYVAGINSGGGLCGYHDWRLPNVNELQTLVNSDTGSNDVWLNSQGFTNVSQNGYWSSTTQTGSPSQPNQYNAWYILMRQRYITSDAKSHYRLTWPVRTDATLTPVSQPARTGQTLCYNPSTAVVVGCTGTGEDGEFQAGAVPPANRFSGGSGAATDCIQDNLTSLMWSKNAHLQAGNQMTWQQALDYIKTLNNGAGLCGYHDWRLPNRVELTSLLDYGRFSNTLPASHPFTNVFPGEYWTSTSSVYMNGADAAWTADFWNGEVYVYMKSVAESFIWPVRDSQSTSNYHVFLAFLIH